MICDRNDELEAQRNVWSRSPKKIRGHSTSKGHISGLATAHSVGLLPAPISIAPFLLAALPLLAHGLSPESCWGVVVIGFGAV